MVVLVIGGSASGKSEYAESRMMAWENRIYFATMLPYGKESERTILRHRLLREGKGFSTIECASNLEQIEIDPESSILLEDLPNLVANELYTGVDAGALDDLDAWLDDGLADDFSAKAGEGAGSGSATGPEAGENTGSDPAAGQEADSDPAESLETDLRHLMRAKNLVIVTGDIFSDGMEYDEDTEQYRRLLAKINVWAARHADEVVEVVCGIPVRRKG